ncbi:MAG: RagB/SusD family nutrient uptake outer membrane protein [Petrimonas sp.]|nr:RagB/SusD family nutrient uptake outer membrane protein [Petrimonas sp.]
MKKYISILLFIVALVLVSCNDNVLDRPQLNDLNDETYWKDETQLRLFANGYYPNYFPGYNSSWSVDYAPLRGYYFSDDFSSTGTQSHFESNVPSSRGSTSETPSMLSQYSGPSWNFAWVRKTNLFINRIETVTKANITDEAYKHWMGVARFFRGYEYYRLVSVFGDVPYYGELFNETDYDVMYKDRTPRAEVMDKVYDDLKYAMENIRANDGDLYLNKYIAAGFIARFMLFEGTWEKYHNGDQARAKKYLEFAVEAGNLVINSGKYKISSDFRSLFGSSDLKGNQEVLLYRHYDAALSVSHAVASYSNGIEGQPTAPNLSLAKAFICNDGQPYQLSAVPNAEILDITNMIKTRDPRFEATFWDKPKPQSSSLLYACKFISREGTTYAEGEVNAGKTLPPQFGSVTNDNDYPVLRYAGVLLDWIEAKAELATMGGAAVTQADIDKSINAIRNRPLDAVAVGKGVKKTAPMQLATLPDDPARDTDVPALIWEIRRERRMEFVYEDTRLLDIKRWKKIQYMNGTTHPDNLMGLWIDVPKELPSFLDPKNKKEGKLKVMKADGTIVTFDGTNGSEMVGFYMIENATDRNEFGDKVYMSPVGKAQIDQYTEKGYTLTQTVGWTN